MRSGSAMISLTVIRGSSDAYGSWNTICMSRRSGRISPGRQRGQVLALEADLPPVGLDQVAARSRPVVDLPQPDSPTRPRVSPVEDVEGDVADRVDLADPAADQPAATDREVLDQVAHRQHRSPVAAGRRCSPSCGGSGVAGGHWPLVGHAPRRVSASTDGRRTRSAASTSTSRSRKWQAAACAAAVGHEQLGLARRRRCPRPAGSAGVNGQPGGRLSSDGGAPLIGVSRSCSALVQAGQAAEQARACTASAAGRRSRRRCPISTSLPAYITSTRSACPAMTPRSCVISTSAAPISRRARPRAPPAPGPAR